MPIPVPPGLRPKAPATGTRIPYLGTTLPPIATMVRYFGPLNSGANETTVRFAGHPVTVNKVIAGEVVAAGNAIAAAGLAGYIRDVGGFRTSVGASGAPIPYSMHQFGAAIDINEDGGPNGDWHTMTLPRPIVAAMAAHHFFCGENWTGASRDGGHFQYTGGTVAAKVSSAVGGLPGQGGPGQPKPAGGMGAALEGALIVGAMVGLVILGAVVVGVAVAFGGSWLIMKLGSDAQG